MKKYLKLFLIFFKIGAFTFGGGFAMIPLIQEEVVEKNKWMNDEEMSDMIAVAESTPGVLAVNTATYVGYKIGGILGSIVTTLGTVIPSIITITIIAMFYDKFIQIQFIKYAFKGIRAAIAVLIFNASLKLYRLCPKTALSYILIVITTLITLFFEINSFLIIILGGLIGLISQVLLGKELNENEH